MKEFKTKNGETFSFYLGIKPDLLKSFNKECGKINNRNKFINLAIEYYLENHLGKKANESEKETVEKLLEKLSTIEKKLENTSNKEIIAVQELNEYVEINKNIKQEEVKEEVKEESDSDILEIGTPKGFIIS